MPSAQDIHTALMEELVTILRSVRGFHASASAELASAQTAHTQLLEASPSKADPLSTPLRAVEDEEISELDLTRISTVPSS